MKCRGWIARCSVTLGMVAAAGLLAAPAAAQEAEPLAASEVADFLGDWTLFMEIQGNPVEMTLSLQDVEGNVKATLQSQRRPEPTEIETLLKTDAGIRLEFQRDFGGQPATLGIDLALADQGLSGTFGDETGFFSATVEGVRAGEERASAASSDEQEERARSRRRRRGGEQAELELSGDKIRIAYPTLKKESDDYGTLESLPAGEVFLYTGGRAVKLLSDASLKFGDTVIEKGNASPDYPGVYSIWLMRAKDEWHLVFNEHADIWGTQHLSEADVAHVPVEKGTAETEAESFTVELVEMGEKAGLLRLAWGSHEWLAPFEVAE